MKTQEVRGKRGLGSQLTRTEDGRWSFLQKSGRKDWPAEFGTGKTDRHEPGSMDLGLCTPWGVIACLRFLRLEALLRRF
jgi:hypothetical protein